MLAQHGVLIGFTLVLAATVTAAAIITRAARSIREFRHDDHELFTRKAD